MTGYYIELGYMSHSVPGPEPWKQIVDFAKKLCDQPCRIAIEAERHGMRIETANEYAASYKEQADLTIQFKDAEPDEDGHKARIVQLASGGGIERDHKEAMRRAFCRLVMEFAHSRQIEVNIYVA